MVLVKSVGKEKCPILITMINLCKSQGKNKDERERERQKISFCQDFVCITNSKQRGKNFPTLCFPKEIKAYLSFF